MNISSSEITLLGLFVIGLVCTMMQIGFSIHSWLIYFLKIEPLEKENERLKRLIEGGEI